MPVVRSLYLPALQAVQAADVDAAATLLYAPTAHAVQALVPPTRLLNFPVVQVVQTRDVDAPPATLE